MAVVGFCLHGLGGSEWRERWDDAGGSPRGGTSADRMILPDPLGRGDAAHGTFDPMPDILLTTINARHQHASLGLRCLLANLGPLAQRAGLLEFVSGARTENLVERILERSPRIVGIGVYIWNVDETTRLVAQLKCVAPEVRVIVGGPEVSHETDRQRICALADHVVTGPGELAFARLCHQLLEGPRPLSKVIAGQAPPASLELPYGHYDERDLRERFVYVEASRGCPFRCEFCLSSLDRTAEPFDLDRFLEAMAMLHARGARVFKFVDRTFNLKVANSLRILEFFLERLERAPSDPVFAHFELVPDHLPPRLRDAIRRFPPGTLQFEIGIQTWNPEVQALISRRQDDAQAEDNLRWLAGHTHAHLHVDLIAGLPGEDLASFGAGFDRLHALGPHEIQVGILKRLRGAPISRHTEAFGLRFNPDPPYNVLATDRIGFPDMQRVARFARYWDLFANSGRFQRTLALLLRDRPFDRFMAFSDWLFANTDATHRLALERQYDLLHTWILGTPRKETDPGRGTAGESAAAAGRDPVASAAMPAGIAAAAARDALAEDYVASGARGRPAFLSKGTAPARVPVRTTPRRQARHMTGNDAPEPRAIE